MRSIPQLAVDFVAGQEDLRLKAYADPASDRGRELLKRAADRAPGWQSLSGEPWTIGYGHTGGVVEGQTCGKGQAVLWLASDMQIAQRKLYAALKPDVIDCLNDHQWSALLSFTFNVGLAPSWTICKLLNAKKFDQAADQLTRFVNANGQRMNGLVNRRAAEFVLFHQGDAVNEELPSSVTRGVGVTPPTPEVRKPWFQSKTLWAGVMTAAGGGTDLATKAQSGALTVQGIVAPQAYHNPWLGKLLGFVSVLIVAAGVAIVVFKLLEQRARTHQ